LERKGKRGENAKTSRAVGGLDVQKGRGNGPPRTSDLCVERRRGEWGAQRSRTGTLGDKTRESLE